MKKATILYFFDPLCLTCYSFRSNLERIRVDFAGRFDFDLIAGGMVTGNRVGPVSQKADYLRKKINAIENTTDARFGEKFRKLLDKGEYVSDSLPPSIAWNVLVSFRKDIRFELAHAIQDAHYRDGKDLNEIRPYFSICEQFEINKRGFLEKYKDPAYKNLTLAEFEKTKEQGVENFPTLLLKSDDKMALISKGYVKLDEFEEKLLVADKIIS